MRLWLRKAVAAVPFSMWLLSLAVSYKLGTVVRDYVFRRYAEAGLGASVVLYILPTLVASWRRHPNFRLLMLTNVFLGVTIAGWFVSFVWSWYKAAKTKYILLSLIMIFVVFGGSIDAFRSYVRTQEAAIAEEVWLVFSITSIGVWMVFALLEAIRVIKNEGKKTMGCVGIDVERQR